MRIVDCQKGRTLIEILGVLSIVAVLIAGATKLLDRAILRYKLTRVSQQVVEVQNAVAKKFVGRREYTGLTLTLLHNDHLLPSDMRYSNNKLYHKLGGEVTVTLAADDTNYVITFKSLPKNACTELVSQNWGLDPRVTLNEMSVGTKKMRWRCETGSSSCYVMPLSVADAHAVCAAASNDVSWNYY
ncbi:MAG: hypothetical protein J6T72_03970 [Alphaproteobacteria bacterium]|nr:hypothetical protein [Alphaproteobacteria bacterium]